MQSKIEKSYPAFAILAAEALILLNENSDIIKTIFTVIYFGWIPISAIILFILNIYDFYNVKETENKNTVVMKFKIRWIVFTFIIIPIVLLASGDFKISSYPSFYFFPIILLTFSISIAVMLIPAILITSWFPCFMYKFLAIIVKPSKWLKNLLDRQLKKKPGDLPCGLLGQPNVNWAFLGYHKLKIMCSMSFSGIMFISACAINDIFYDENSSIFFIAIIAYIILLILIIIILNWALNFKLILDDHGITKGDKHLPWSKVCRVEYEDIWFGGDGFIFMYRRYEGDDYKYIFQNINFLFTNNKEGLEFALRKLGKLSFSSDALKKLRKMDINLSQYANHIYP